MVEVSRLISYYPHFLMNWYYYIAWLAIVLQIAFVVGTVINYRYAIKKRRRKRDWYRPRAVLIVPCKGLDLAFERNVQSFFAQDYDNYLLWFVVEDKDDSAYEQLCKLKEQLSGNSKALDVQILVAGHSQSCSQKNHNLLYCIKHLPDDVEILSFADSDVCIPSDWLSHIVYPLRNSKYGVASGYRWFIPDTNNLATLALSAINAKIVQLLGNSPFNHVWGGSMAVRVDVFQKLGIDEIWQKSLSDDLSLSMAVKKAGMKVAFVPACLVGSYESVNWKGLLEFGRRQFLITRICVGHTWLIGLLSSLYTVAGLWVAGPLAVYAAHIKCRGQLLFVAVPVVFFTSQLFRAVLRQNMAAKILDEDPEKLRVARNADIFLFWIWSPLLLLFIISSAFGRTITWRQVKYKLLGPTKVVVIKQNNRRSNGSA